MPAAPRCVPRLILRRILCDVSRPILRRILCCVPRLILRRILCDVPRPIPLRISRYICLTFYITFCGRFSSHFATLSKTITARFTRASFVAKATWGVAMTFFAFKRG